MTSKVQERFGKAIRLILAILGVFPISNPLSSVPDLKFRPVSIYSALCLLQGLAPIVLLFDSALSNPSEMGTGSSNRLSRKLLVYSAIPFIGGPALGGRLHALIACQQITDLFRATCAVRDTLTTAGFLPTSLSKGKKIILGVYVGYFALGLSSSILSSIVNAGPTNQHDLNYTLLPKSMVPVVGLLLMIQDGLYRLLAAQLTDCTDAAAGNISVIQQKSVANGRDLAVCHDVVNFASVFKTVKSVFESYQSIAGWLCLGLTCSGMIEIIKSFSLIMIDPEKLLPTGTIALVSVVLIMLLSCFGDYFKQSVLSNQRKIEDLAGHKPNGNVQWYLSWRVELTAVDFFTVHHTLILNVIATVITYFIFMSQLKLTEDAEGAPICNCTCNCID